ncbi:MAG: proton-conducting transporter membrane subunit, partial [Chloroflexota bacterium]
MDVDDLLILSTILLPWLGAAVLWLTGAAARSRAGGAPPERLAGLQNGLAAAFSLAGAPAALGLLFFPSSAASIRIPVGDFFGELTFVPDGLGVFLAIIASGIGSLAVIFSIDYMKGDPQLGRFYMLVLIFIGAMSGLVLTGSLLFLFVFWEITALCSYGLISFYNDDPKAVAGGIKALIITQVGGVGLLAG